MPLDRRPSAFAPRGLPAAAAAASALLCGAAPAWAAVTMYYSVPRYIESQNVIAHAAGQAENSSTRTASASRTLPRFDLSYGVLQSAELLLSNRITATGAVAAATDFFVPSQVVVGHGASVATFSGPGFSESFGPLLHAATCQTGVGQLGCSAQGTPAERWFYTVYEMDPAALAARPGEETFTVHHSVQTTAAVTRAPTAPSSYYSTLTWDVDGLFVLYDYLRHAAPSFADGASQLMLDLDFGTILQGDPAALAFGIFDNTFRANESVGFRLAGVLGSGDTSALTTDAVAGLDFAAGGMGDFTAFLDSRNPGDFSATYRFDLQEVGPGVGHANHGLILNLRGQVLAGPAAVPEPGAWALMITGFGLAGAALRRRRAAPPIGGGVRRPAGVGRRKRRFWEFRICVGFSGSRGRPSWPRRPSPLRPRW